MKTVLSTLSLWKRLTDLWGTCGRGSRRQAGTRRTFRPRFERMEDRRLLSVSTESSGPAQAGWSTVEVDGAEAVADRLIVRFADSVDLEAAARAVAGRLGGTLRTVLPSIHGGVVELGQRGANLLAVAGRWQSDRAIVYAEPDYVAQFDAIPNDPDFARQWALHNTGQTGGKPDADIDATEAWDTTAGSPDVVVASIDSGVDYTHPDLAANIWVNPGEVAGNGVDDDGNGYVDDVHGIDVGEDDGDPLDRDGHGTHTSGTIAAAGDDGQGVTGVAWNVKIMAMRLGSAFGVSDCIECLDYLTMMKTRYGVNIVASNNSYGLLRHPQSFRDAIAASNDAGILFVAAAGNSGRNNDLRKTYPASYDLPGILAVTATDADDRLASFSNYGRKTVDLGAPGVGILSTYPGGEYRTWDGTSMAAPHVAGAVALAKSWRPDATPAEVKAAILSSVDRLPSLARTTASGGRLNVSKMLAQLGHARPLDRAAGSPQPTLVDAVLTAAEHRKRRIV